MQLRPLGTMALLLSLLLPVGTTAAPPAKVPVLLDTDIGGDVDDAFALALALSHPGLDLRGVTTAHGDAHTRALVVCRLLHAVGRDDVPVASGARERASPDYEGQMQYGLRPCFRKRPVKEPAVEFLYKQLKAQPGELTLVALGPLTNFAGLFTRHPECKPWVKRVVVMGGAVRVGYKGKPPAEPEWNVKSDVKSAKTVFSSGVPLLVVPLDCTVDLTLDAKQRKAIFRHHSPLTDQLEALYQLWGKETPTLFDPAAVALAADESWGKVEPMELEVDEKGMTRAVKGKPNARVATSVRREAFLKSFVERLTAGPPGKPVRLRATNPARPVARGNFPHAVHVVEDYETDVERRWWLAGLPQTRDAPPGSKRACRGVLCDDFDDRTGDPRRMYTAVIFNPVPGPPVGKNTRLSFRYRLRGAGTLGVQIYSLSKGYHRHLTLTDLPQGKWQQATVDMTAARRPDGSGGPLSEGERIDDIQLYTERDAELLVDDVVLYDSAPARERRPFPRRIFFTGWFDTGRQGKEWPGSFEIVTYRPPLGKAARSVTNPATRRPWVRVGLRGERPLAGQTRLRFRYRLTGADTLDVALAGRGKETRKTSLRGLKKGGWAAATVDFGKARPGETVEEVRFLLPKGAELLVDDVLLYEPGEGGR